MSGKPDIRAVMRGWQRGRAPVGVAAELFGDWLSARTSAALSVCRSVADHDRHSGPTAAGGDDHELRGP